MAEPQRPEVVLVRHGETEWSRARKHTGRSDISLTEHGRAQARHIAAAVASFPFVHVLTSPLSRARETAQLVALEAQIEPALMEWDYGRYEGLTTAEIRVTEPGWSVWTHPIEGGESIEDVAARVDGLVERILGFEGPIALVAHAHLLRILGARWLDLAAVEGRRFTLDTATISILGWERENRVIRRWNDPCGWS
jgi:broad specificity phosphatase PhoE